jgi:hypothetical protein
MALVGALRQNENLAAEQRVWGVLRVGLHTRC